MKVTDYFQQSQAVSQAENRRAERNNENNAAARSSASFDSVLSETAQKTRQTNEARSDRPEAAERKPADKPKEAVNNPPKDEKPTSAKESGDQAQKTGDKPQDKPVDGAGKTAEEKSNEAAKGANETDKAQDTGGKAAATEKTVITPEEQQALMQNIAQLLGISADMVASLMADLNLTAADLTVTANATALMQAAVGASSPVELLYRPDVVQTLEAMTRQAKAFLDNKPADVSTAQLKAVSAEAVQTGAANEPVITPVVQAANSENAAQGSNQNTAQSAGQEAAQTSVNQDNQAATAVVYEAPKTEDGAVTTGTATAEESVIPTRVTADKPVQTPDALPKVKEADAEASQPEAEINPMVQNIGTYRAAQTTSLRNPEAGRVGIDTQDVINQLVERMKVDVRQDTTELRLTLKPESLGEVQMRIVTQNGVVTAQFYAENQRVKEILESQFNQLKDALTEKGVLVGDMSAYVGQENANQNSGQADNSAFGGEGRISARRISSIMSRNGIEGLAPDDYAENGADGTENPLEINVTA
ncbi:MAG: flagellar hook-length control protein FliK [Clostridiales bacterium]|jgi:flagellar hook-length control protein FliK|nr:flagellar hook-length control protein FliK [Clostridiales bacterium]